MNPGPVVNEGDRVVLIRWGPSSVVDDNTTVPPGTVGTVQGYHPDVNQVWMEWDNGSALNLMIDHDSWRKVEPVETHELSEQERQNMRDSRGSGG